MFYGVVEFKPTKYNSNKELSVVPLTWLIKNDKKCYWPAGTNKVPLSEFIKSCPLPKKSWPHYAVLKVHLKTENYELAEKELDRVIAEYEESANFTNQSVGRKSVISNSSASSDDDYEVPLKKQKKRDGQISDFLACGSSNLTSVNIVNMDNNITNSPCNQAPQIITNILATSASSLASRDFSEANNANNNSGVEPLQENVHSTILYTPTASSTSTMTIYSGMAEALNSDIIIGTDPMNCSNSYTLCPENTGANSNLGFQQTVLSALGTIQSTNEQILLTMQEILRYNKKIAMEKLIAPENLPSFPLKTYEEFLNFENLIKKDPTVNQYMVRRLAALGGSGIEGVTRRIMKFLLDNQLGVQFNWKGRFNKVSFEETGSMGIVYEAAKLNFPSNEKNDLRIAWSVKEWLKHSTTRISQAGKHRM